jgi:hypothetical protein
MRSCLQDRRRDIPPITSLWQDKSGMSSFQRIGRFRIGSLIVTNQPTGGSGCRMMRCERALAFVCQWQAPARGRVPAISAPAPVGSRSRRWRRGRALAWLIRLRRALATQTYAVARWPGISAIVRAMPLTRATPAGARWLQEDAAVRWPTTGAGCRHRGGRRAAAGRRRALAILSCGYAPTACATERWARCKTTFNRFTRAAPSRAGFAQWRRMLSGTELPSRTTARAALGPKLWDQRVFARSPGPF